MDFLLADAIASLVPTPVYNNCTQFLIFWAAVGFVPILNL